MIPLVKSGGQVFLGLTHERLVKADYSLQHQDRKLFIDASEQAVNISLLPISELVEGTHFQLVIVEMGLGISIDGSAIPSDAEQVFIQVKSEYKMTYKLQVRDTDAPHIKYGTWDGNFPFISNELVHNDILIVNAITQAGNNGIAAPTTRLGGYVVLGDKVLVQDEGEDYTYSLLERTKKHNTVEVTNSATEKTLEGVDVFPYEKVFINVVADTESGLVRLPTPEIDKNTLVNVKALTVSSGQTCKVAVPVGIKLNGTIDAVDSLQELESHTYLAISATEWVIV